MVVGGWDGHTAQKTSEVLSPGAHAWKWGPLLLDFRSQLSGVTLNSTVFVSGGVDRDDSPRDEVRLIDQLWQSMLPPTPSVLCVLILLT